jgi:small-conductance mechanosensitive channel/CRP-like cAMP-binding protein
MGRHGGDKGRVPAPESALLSAPACAGRNTTRIASMNVLVEANQVSLKPVLGLDWTIWLYPLLLFGVVLAVFFVLRQLLMRRWPRLQWSAAMWACEAVVLLVLVTCARALLLQFERGPGLLDTIDTVFGGVLCFAFVWLVDRATTLFILPRTHHRRGTSVTVPGILQTFISIALYAIGVLAFLVVVLRQDALGFVVSGSVLLGVLGLALQDILRDAFAGVAVSLDEPFRLGDWVELEDGTVGQVADIRWRSTRLYSFEHGTTVIPNARISAYHVHNHTVGDPSYAISMYVSLPNEVDPVMGRRLLLEATLATPGVLREPAPIVRVADGGSRPYQYLLYFFCTDFMARIGVRSGVYENIWRHLKPLGVFTAPGASDTRLHRTSASQGQLQQDDIAALIGQAPLFAPLTRDEREALAASVDYRLSPAGTTIVSEGEAGQSLFLVAGGQVQVRVCSEDEPIARLGKGEQFGEMSLLTGAPRAATVEAITDCTLLEIDKDALTPIVQARSELGDELARVQAYRQLELEQALQDNKEITEADIRKQARKVLTNMKRFFRV